MARPGRKTVDYFPHYISDGKKMFYIEQKYGNDGYASWFKILESLASTDDHFINLNNQMDLLFLSAKCRVDETKLLEIINDLSMLGEIDEFLWMNKMVYSHKFIESIQDAYARRTNKCMDYDSFCMHYQSLCTTITLEMYKKSNRNPQSKVNKSKVNKSKANEIKEKENKELLFDSWWNLYAKKTGREKSIEKWLKLSLDEINECLKVVNDYVKSTPDKQFRKDPITYLNGKHWKDEIIFKQQNNNGNQNNNNTAPVNAKLTLSERMAEVKRRASERRNQQSNSEGSNVEPFSDFENVN